MNASNICYFVLHAMTLSFLPMTMFILLTASARTRIGSYDFGDCFNGLLFYCSTGRIVIIFFIGDKILPIRYTGCPAEIENIRNYYEL